MTLPRRPFAAAASAAALLLGLSAAWAGPPAGDDCNDCIPVSEGAHAGTTFDNTAGADITPCGFQDFFDEWYCYTPTCDGLATASTCDASLMDTTLAVFAACGGAMLACNDDQPECAFDTSRITWPVTRGATYYIRIAAVFSVQGDYVMTITCTGCPGPGNCFVPADTAGCADQTCCSAVCDKNPACCEAQWDASCVEDAIAQCATAAACPGQGSCLEAAGTPGCIDAACCNAVCMVDAFCCDIAWDAICAETAASECTSGACPGSGSCFASHPGGGCDDAICCATVCMSDPACCQGSWDAGCATQAAALCGWPGCGSSASGDCFQAKATPACNIELCCAAVCAADSACCLLEWDQACADQAAALCAAPNDLCADRIEIGAGTIAFHTHGAATDGATLAGFCDPGPAGDEQVHNDIWYVWEAPCSGTLTVSTCSSADFDTRLALYEGDDCPAAPADVLACNDDAAGCSGFTSQVSAPVVEGERYTIRLGAFSASDVGSGLLEVSLEPSAPAALTLAAHIAGPALVGDQFQATLIMSGLCVEAAAGFQAFIEFDPAQSAFVSGTYTSEPFGLPILGPITASVDGHIALAAAVNPFAGQPATTGDAVLAVLTFEILSVPAQCIPDIAFADHDPPTRLTNVGGNEILPLELDLFPGPRSAGDVNGDGFVDVQDLVIVILTFGFCPGSPVYCPADLDCSGEVDVVDLVQVILNWAED